MSALTDEQAERIIFGVHCGEVDATELRCIAEDAGAWLAESSTGVAAELRRDAGWLAICRDDDCPSCEWPETYAEGPSGAAGPSHVGCRKCGWRAQVIPTP